jgi:signal transduction histidine kinase
LPTDRKKTILVASVAQERDVATGSMTSSAASAVLQLESASTARRQRATTVARLCGLAVGLGIVYALLLEAALWFLHPRGGSAFFPAAGLALSVLVLTPRRMWPTWLGAVAAAQIAFDLWHARPFVPTLGYTVADVAEPLVGALLLAAALRGRRGPRAVLASFVLFPVLLAPVVGAVIGATSNVVIGPGKRTWWTAASTWWVADALGVLVIGSLILAWSRPPASEERVSLPAVAAVATVGAAAIIVSGVVWHYPLVYLALPCLVWAAFVGGARAVTAVGAAAALAADWVAITGRAGRIVASPQSTEQLAFLQLFLGVTFLTGLYMTVEIAERRRSRDLALEARRQLAISEETAVKIADAERDSIVRDTHDIVGHGVNAMLLQIGAARRVYDDDPAVTRELLASAEAIGRAACDDLELALGLVGHEPRVAGRGLQQLPALVDMLRRAGLSVELSVEGERVEISTLVDWSAYRIAQEALTNVIKHASGASASVRVCFDNDAVHLSIVDDGEANEDDRSFAVGRGIIGMRERTSAVGGTLDVGPNRERGFTVEATLPANPHNRGTSD